MSGSTKNNFKKDLPYQGEDQPMVKMRLDLVEVIRNIISENGWTQSQAALKMDISRAKLCKLIGGQWWYTSELRLIKSIVKAGFDVEIIIKKRLDSKDGNIIVNRNDITTGSGSEK